MKYLAILMPIIFDIIVLGVVVFGVAACVLGPEIFDIIKLIM